MILTRRLRINFKSQTKLIISKQRVPSSMLPLLTEEAPLLVLFSPCYALCLGHFEFKTLLTLSSAFSERPIFFCTRPSNRSYVQNRHKRVFFLRPRNFCILQNYKPPFEGLGSYEFRQSLLSRNSCLVPDSGSTPK
jgi:hypothetical protein